jgi:hypothetical protein
VSAEEAVPARPRYTLTQATLIYLVWQYTGDVFRKLAQIEGPDRSHWHDAMDYCWNEGLFRTFKTVDMRAEVEARPWLADLMEDQS